MSPAKPRPAQTGGPAARRTGKPSGPRVSVIIPVYNDAPRLRTCLERLAAQTLPPAQTEVLVVDNGSADPGATRAAAQAAYPSAVVLDEPAPGSYAARNRALRAARGDLLAFTDADCLPEPDWLERGVARLEADDAPDLVGGRVVLFPRDPGRPSPAEVFSMAFEMRQDRWLARFGFAATANVFTRRAVFERVGPFDAAKKSGGDAEWGSRVKASGGKLVYEPAAIVRHPARRWHEVRQKARRNMGGVSGEAIGRLGPLWLVGQGLLALMTPVASLRHLPRGWRIAGLRGAWGIYVSSVAVDALRLWEFARLRLGGKAQR